MSLARRLMNGEIGGLNVSIDESRYSADNGAAMIAMESAAELYSIAQEFYNYEQADISAIVEGVALEGSQYEPVAEASIKNAFLKIKEAMQKLWAKIKAWFKNVGVFLDALFKNAKDFVKKYKDQISGLKNVKLENVKIWDYNNEAIDTEYDVAKASDGIDKDIQNCYKNITSSDTDTKEIEAFNKGREDDSAFDKDIEKLNEVIDTKLYEIASNNNASTSEEFSKYVYNVFRGSSSTAELDKPTVTITEVDIKKFASVIEASKGVQSIKTVQGKVDAMFKKALATVNKIESQCNNAAKSSTGEQSTGYTRYAKLAQMTHKSLSKQSTIVTTFLNGQKAAMKERDTAYKTVISMGLRYSNRKSAK